MFIVREKLSGRAARCARGSPPPPPSPKKKEKNNNKKREKNNNIIIKHPQSRAAWAIRHVGQQITFFLSFLSLNLLNYEIPHSSLHLNPSRFNVVFIEIDYIFFIY